MPPILEVRDLKVRFPVFGGVLLRKTGEVRAVDGVSFSLNHGETLGVVGESGCGKTTVGRAIVNILRAMSYQVEISGQVLYHSPTGVVDLANLSKHRMRPYRTDLQMIFQDPYSSLNPRLSVEQILEEPLKIHTKQSSAERKDRVRWLMDKVGLSRDYIYRYPHEFSGGQRQRIGIARALATNPKIVIADEPVSALDVSIQAQVVNLMQDLQKEFGLSYIFIAHDLSVVRHISNRIAVMYLGNIVEMGEADRIYTHPMHPYSRALLSAVPRPDPGKGRRARQKLTGDVPNPANKPSGCAFRTRCPIARPVCADFVPPLEMREGRLVACPFSES
ncbi:MAG TPA: oligopeptide/dipeptide ABC transporter ATP-binding protein [Vicinamibacterales bacterium]|jgi:oligopeptide/dipeptide ABC transporter ATP-binding protein|nr:oligopeptide/dipeptide ABC transporter ATP-binding protein [Vicinamibacterales bacterium]